jgi:hypothetical protein
MWSGKRTAFMFGLFEQNVRMRDTPNTKKNAQLIRLGYEEKKTIGYKVTPIPEFWSAFPEIRRYGGDFHRPPEAC